MILTVTLNVALDVTYEMTTVTWGGSNRVARARRRAGGKGVNVARVAAALGEDVLVTGLAGGGTGDLVRADLAASGLRHALMPVRGTSRNTVTVVATGTGDATVFNEAGPEIDPGEWDAFQEHYRSLLARSHVVVLSGSLPPGVPRDAYATLTALAADRPVIIDADGDALSQGVRAGPAVVKPNADELRRATGLPPVPGSRALQAAGARAVLVSLGPDGLLATTPDGVWRAKPPGPVTGNPTGAGDAAVAATARALLSATPWPDLLRHAAALSAAAVRAPLAGDFDAAAYPRLLPEIIVEGPSCPS
ncbi:1-phosphofructokinase family hexose kinase [Actinomadura rubrisoli]|uniref:1-phosphofructokinase n=1 Tax=Actinomadura rubrisoli TaxID=2530368 RepID=A0A4R5A1D7_9ACTN|nr:hexose kinase [Actinomadura rubrisoli]TDD63322.1 1-phosphofructokinase [Actinomadura rubrisoli]